MQPCLIVITFFTDLWQVGGFRRILLFHPKQTNRRHDIADFFRAPRYQSNRIGGVMVSVLALSAVDRGFRPPIRSNQEL
jgi:hypothetical protein